MGAIQTLLAAACVSLLAGPVVAQDQAAPAASPYAGADSCKTCHQAIYDSWANTKHAKAINALAAPDREGDKCIGCHVTGTPQQIAAEGAKPSLPNVQCESCHGPGAAHAADAKVMTGLVRKPGESSCTSCHNDKSPHFRGFVFVAMKGFVHPVKK